MTTAHTATPEEIKRVLFSLEASSQPGLGKPSSKKSATINGHTVEAVSKWNRGRIAGKGFSTLFYVDGNRIAKANIVAALAKDGIE